MGVVLLLAIIWAAVLVPPAVRSHAARKQAFLLSFGPAQAALAAGVRPPSRPRSTRVQRRRRIAGGLLVAMAATLLIGLLPTFRVLLVVHLFVVDSFLGYLSVLAHVTNRSAPRRVPQQDVAEVPLRAGAEPRRRRSVPRPAMLGDFGPIAPAG